MRMMGFALPADFDAGDSSANNVYLYVDAYNAVTETTGGYVFMSEDGSLSSRTGPSGDPLLASIDIHGDYDGAKAMVGVYMDFAQDSVQPPAGGFPDFEEEWWYQQDCVGNFDDLGGNVSYWDCCASVTVYHTVELDTCCPEWEAACKDPSGPYTALVSYSNDGEKAFATTSGTLDPTIFGEKIFDRQRDFDTPETWGHWDWDFEDYQAGLSDESAFSVSLDDAVSFNQIGLIDTDIDALADVAVCPLCDVIYLATMNEMEEWCNKSGDKHDMAQTSACDSIWRSFDGGDSWERVYHGDWSNDLEDNPILLRLPCDAVDDCCDHDDLSSPSGTVYMGIGNTDDLFYSRDCGQCWTSPPAQKILIQDFAVESENIVYVLDADGYVSVSTQYGRHPADEVDTGVGSGHTITSCCAQDGIVAVGGFGDEPVGWSDDGGESWNLTDDLPNKSGDQVHVACYDCDGTTTLFAAVSDNNDGGIYRTTIDSGAWDDLNALPYDYDGIAIGRSDGTLYAVTDAIAIDTDPALGVCDRFVREDSILADEWYSGVARNLTPCETDCCGEESWDYLIAGLTPAFSDSPEEDFDNEPSALRICGCTSIDTNSILWAIDTDDYEVSDGSDGSLWSYEDCAAKKGIVLTSPADGAVLDCDVCDTCEVNPFTLKWERMCLACSYDIEMMDEDGNLIWSETDIAISGDPPELYLGSAEITVPVNLYCGSTYTWHVREANTSTGSIGECVHSPWSETWSFTIGASAWNSVMLIAPEVGAMGVRHQLQLRPF